VNQTTVPQIAPTEVAALLENGAVLVDVREPQETAFGAAPEASFIPLQSFTLESVSPDVAVVLICRSGARSQMAAAALAQHGFTSYNVAGGMQAWAAAGLPVVAADGNPGLVM